MYLPHLKDGFAIAGCIILDNEGRVLLLHRNVPPRIQWEIPGGKVENGEMPEEAARREAKEEIGAIVEIIKKLGTHEFIGRSGVAKNFTWFLAVIVAGGPSLTEIEKFDDLQYFTWEDLRNMQTLLSSNTRHLVNAYFNNKLDLRKTSIG